ncbi:response regulator [Geoalkalibacter halelectricus]|uniref:response regulator n=1 Tax=Geoalkalibacter halelectricus TaxID=2847045 RepID=UPI003D1EFF4B
MLIRCPLCGARYRVAPERVRPGIRIRCPKCNDVFALRTLPESPSEEPTSVARRPKVAIVEDARFFRELVRDVLAPLNLEVCEAADGEQGLELVRTEKPDLVILDLNLPRRDGYELMKLIRADLELRHVRLLAMSGVFRKESDQDAALAAGADDFIGKSFTPDLLLDRVRKLLKAKP